MYIHHFAFQSLKISTCKGHYQNLLTRFAANEKISKEEAAKYKNHGTIEVKLFEYRTISTPCDHVAPDANSATVPFKGVGYRNVTLGVA